MNDVVVNHLDGEFETPVYALGYVTVDLMCLPEHIEVKVNKDKGYIPYYVAYFVYSSCFEFDSKGYCNLIPDLQFSDMGKCSNCGNLCSLDDRYCSNCGFEITKS